MIKVFSPTDKTFNNNGDFILPATRAVVHEVDNGDFFLEIEAPVEYNSFLSAGNIIVCNTPNGEQAFRIGNNIETTRTKVKIKAFHVFYDSQNYLIADSYIIGENLKTALKQLNQATDNPSPFSVTSDVLGLNSLEVKRLSLYESIISCIELWGGHIVRDNFKIKVFEEIGNDNGVTIQYKKNLKEITKTENWGGVCTKLLPVGKDNIMLDELYISSSVQYDIPFTKTIQFEQDINAEDYPDEASYIKALKKDLKTKAKDYLSVSQYPSINYTVKANVDKIDGIGDVVAVYDERLEVSLLARVISYDFNPLTNQFIQIEFGTITPKLSGLINGINSEVKTAVTMSAQNMTDYVNENNKKINTKIDNNVAALQALTLIKSGITYHSDLCIVNGFINPASTELTFTIPLDRSTQNVNSVNITQLNINAFTIEGSLFAYNSAGHDILNDGSLTVAKTLVFDGVRVTIGGSFGVTGATPVSVEIVNGSFTFT